MPRLDEITADPDYLALGAQEQDRVRMAYLRKYVMTDPDYLALSQPERSAMANRIVSGTPADTQPSTASRIPWAIGQVLRERFVEPFQRAGFLSPPVGAALESELPGWRPAETPGERTERLFANFQPAAGVLGMFGTAASPGARMASQYRSAPFGRPIQPTEVLGPELAVRTPLIASEPTFTPGPTTPRQPAVPRLLSEAMGEPGVPTPAEAAIPAPILAAIEPKILAAAPPVAVQPEPPTPAPVLPPSAPAVTPPQPTPVAETPRGMAQGPGVTPAVSPAPVALEPAPGAFSKGDPVSYQPKLGDNPITGKVSNVNADGTVNIRARAGGVIRKVPADKVKSLLTPEEVGLDSKRIGKRVDLGVEDKAILGEMRQTISDTGGEVAGKIFLEKDEVGQGGGMIVKGFKTPKPPWMEIPDEPGEYYEYPEAIKTIETLRQGKWPKTKRQERIAEQLLQETRFDAENEKARLAGWERQALESETAPAPQPSRELAIQDAFFAEVDQLAAEEQAAPGLPAKTGGPTQSEMFKTSETTPGITPGKMGTTVPQVAIGDELLAGMRRPEPETQGVIPETEPGALAVQEAPPQYGSAQGPLTSVAAPSRLSPDAILRSVVGMEARQKVGEPRSEMDHQAWEDRLRAEAKRLFGEIEARQTVQGAFRWDYAERELAYRKRLGLPSTVEEARAALDKSRGTVQTPQHEAETVPPATRGTETPQGPGTALPPEAPSTPAEGKVQDGRVPYLIQDALRRPPPSGGIDPAPIFYSQLARTIEQKMPNRASPEQVSAIARSGGVKEDEIKWTGLDDWLKEQKGPVSKQDVAEFLRANQVAVQESIKPREANPALVLQREAAGRSLRNQEAALKSIQSPDEIPVVRQATEGTRKVWLKINDWVKSQPELDAYLQEWHREMDDPNWRSNSIFDAVVHADKTLDRPPGYRVQEVYDRLVKEVPNSLRQAYFAANDKLVQVSDAFWKDLKAREPEIEAMRQDINAARQRYDSLTQQVEGGSTKFSTWQLPGGGNYRELVLTLPYEKPFRDFGAFRSTHWDEPNVLAHVRFNERTDAQGKKVLFIEEIQSDWATALRKSWQGGRPPEGVDLQLGQTPGMPFAKTWHELVLKRILRWGVEHGFDKIAWTTGEQQAARYDLSKQVDEVEGYKFPDGTFKVTATQAGMRVMERKAASEGELVGLVGKDLAARIAAQQTPSIEKYAGVDLKVGGEWATHLYDEMIPQFLNKYGRKWGARVDTTTFDLGRTPPSTGIDLRVDRQSDGFYIIDAAAVHKRVEGPFTTEREAMNKLNSMSLSTNPSIHITPEMKHSVMFQGQPLFALIPPLIVSAALAAKHRDERNLQPAGARP